MIRSRNYSVGLCSTKYHGTVWPMYYMYSPSPGPHSKYKIIKPNKQDLCVDGESRVVCLNHFGLFLRLWPTITSQPQSSRQNRLVYVGDSLTFMDRQPKPVKKLSLCGIAFSQQTNMYHRFMFSILIRSFRFISSWQMMRFFYFCKGLGEQSAQTRLCYLE